MKKKLGREKFHFALNYVLDKPRQKLGKVKESSRYVLKIPSMMEVALKRTQKLKVDGLDWILLRKLLLLEQLTTDGYSTVVL